MLPEKKDDQSQEPTSLSTSGSTLSSSDLPAVPPLPAPPSLPKKSFGRRLGGIVLLLLVIAGCTASAYIYGNNHGSTAQKNTTSAMMKAENTALTLPRGVTVVSPCTIGEGTQYILPKNIPTGPIYNVWNNKVIGIEFMLSQNSLLTLNQNYSNLSLSHGKFDHLDIVYEPVGHAGFTEAHDHFVLSTISYADEKKITCSGQSSGMSMSM